MKGKQKSKHLSLLILLLLLVGVAGALVVTWFRPYKNYPEDEKFVLVARGTRSVDIARQLEGEGIISHRALFLAYLKTIKRSSRLQAGEYRFDKALTIAQVADKMIRGLIYYHEVTIPEGFSLFDIADLLEQKGFVTRKDFLAAVSRGDLIADLVPAVKNLEGFLYPDTYRLTRGATADEIVHNMVERFRQVYGRNLEPAIKQSSLSLKEAVTLASLIEKETGLDEERELVSAVFHNRLKRQIPLQCDPTVIYAAKLKGGFKGEIYQSDLELKSPYNTYRFPGLPPGPISNPGLKSLEAALKPARVDYLYFVSNNSGGHVFSTTLDEHNRAVAAYRNGLRLESKRAAPKQGPS
ncbi:MAG: endolytic transglycosylase MltG [Acidobacteria bacterium]|nr:MAG: endolytic transglycosylase MltG [Acidobacteriota bacterium]